MKLTKKDRNALLNVLSALKAGQAYIRNPQTVVCRRKTVATTTEDLSRPDGKLVCVPVDTEIGSDLAQLHTGIGLLEKILGNSL